MPLLRLQADDPAVLARTAEAVEASRQVKRPPLTFQCARCQTKLARVGDVPGYGPLFTSSWEVWPEEESVVVNGRELRGRERSRWLAEHYETIEQSGRNIDAPLRHGVVALLALPTSMAQDHPDLLMRCNSHGDFVADRREVYERLRGIPTGRVLTVKVTPTGWSEYRPPSALPGAASVPHRTVRRLRSDSMPVEEFIRRTRDRAGGK